MNRQKSTWLSIAGVALLVVGAAAQTTPPAAQGAQAPAARPRLVAPIRGEAPMGYTKPVVKPAKIDGRDFVVTTMRVKNLATGAIAGLRIDEFWYNKAGDPVTGANFRHPKPLQPGEVITVTLQTPRNPSMDRNQYKFEHANGTVKMTLLPKL